MAEDAFGIVGTLQAGVFDIERVVAEGGFGIVYEAQHRAFGAKVALKCLKVPAALSADQRQAFLLRFQKEGELMFRLSALIPTVVRPLHVGVLDGAAHGVVPFIALEWLAGESLEARVQRRQHSGKPALELSRLVRLLGPVARALECAHRFPALDGSIVSILHRDLKPENVFLVKVHGHELPKLLDFGIGQVKSLATQIVGRVSSEQPALSAFTPAYAAPEQWLPRRFGQTGPWTDVWGLALCLVEALTARAPFAGDAAAIMGACIDEAARPTPREFGAKISERADAAFRRALAVDPARRFQDIGSFWDELEACVNVHTPRIALAADAGAGSDDDSILPPPGTFSRVPRPALTPSPAVATPPAREPVPELRFSALPASPAASTASKRRPASTPEVMPDPSQLTVMRGGSLSQLSLASDLPPAAPLSVRKPVARAVGGAAFVRSLTSRAPSAERVFRKLSPSLKLIALGVLIMGADFVYAAHAGSGFSLGPARAFWIAAPLVLFGFAKLFAALLSA